MNKIKKILIANRSEIACRIIRTAHDLGIKTVAIYSDADIKSLHVKYADEAVYIGKSHPTYSYLNINSILQAIKLSGADSVHPGYGFLSESYEFVKTIEESNINFIGPSASSIKIMGDKVEAKKLASSAGVNVIPGATTVVQDEIHAIKIAQGIGYPVMLKAVAGGGGKGIRAIKNDAQMQQVFHTTKDEAYNSFADSRIFIEKLINRPRHIEIQILGDQHGNYVCLGERECSIQRHNQKIIEESPSLFITFDIRERMYAQSIKLAKKVKYFSAGTIEYIVDQDGNFFFLEMNTRLQVEHTVTELITGIDIVEQMIKISQGQKLPFKQKDIFLNGWAIESRIYAENTSYGFFPSSGKITEYQEPRSMNNIRLDTGIYKGAEVSIFYDAMIAKLCTHSNTRNKAINLMKESLGEYIIEGVLNNIEFLQRIFHDKEFFEGNISTNFINERCKKGYLTPELQDKSKFIVLCATVFIFISNTRRIVSSNINKQQETKRNIGTRWIVKLNDDNYPVTVRNINSGYKIFYHNRTFIIISDWKIGQRLFRCSINSVNYTLQLSKIKDHYIISIMGCKITTRLLSPRVARLYKFIKKPNISITNTNLLAMITGLIKEISVIEREKVTKGQPLIILEAMKMENILVSPVHGTIKKIHCTKGSTALSGDTLIEIQPF